MSLSQPNILIFMMDQQRGDTILQGTPYKALTPNLDRFRKESVTFTRAFCPSPHCCPSRATFFTGLYPSQHGVWNNILGSQALSRVLQDGVKLWSEDLAAAGYAMYFTGRWHISTVDTPSDRGWTNDDSDPSGSYSNKIWNSYRGMADTKSLADRREAEIHIPGYSTYTHYGIDENPKNDNNTVNRAINTIRSRTRHVKPWCHYIGTNGPHDPYVVPQRFLDMYSLDNVSLPPSFHDDMGDKPGHYRRLRDKFGQLTEREHKEALRHYLAFCSYEDDLFGKVLDALHETGEIDNTIVIYLSDHGDYGGEHGLWSKGLPCFNSGYHIPLVIRWPNGIVNPGREVDELVSLADIAPTILEAVELSTDRFAGRSLLPWLKEGEPAQWRDALFTQTNGNELYGMQRSVMTKDWKYVYNGFDYDELYDLKQDPYQQHNLIHHRQYKEVVQQLCKRIWQFAYDHGDTSSVTRYVTVALAPVGPGCIFIDDHD